MKAFELLDRPPLISDYFSRFSKIIIYGAGNSGREVFGVLKNDLKHEVVAFLDRNAQPNSFIEGVPVLKPENISISVSAKKECLVIIAVFNRDVGLAAIFQLLRNLNFENIISFVQFHHFYSNELGNKFWLGKIDAYRNFKEQIEEVNNLWADETSKLVFESVLKYRFTGDSQLLTEPEGLDTQYFSNTLEPPKNRMRFIDGGAYDGDTLLAMLEMGIHCEAVASFEPDLKNFAKLLEFSASHRDAIARENYLFPCAVWSKTEYLKFNSDSTEASSVSKDGAITILGVAIDQIIPTFGPDFIKMDIEGAEIDGLHGARETIKEFRPRLGICVYHKPEHLWEIPLLVKSWNLNYKFCLRSHGNNGFDLVLYAIPK